MTTPMTYAELRKLSDAELNQLFENLAQSTQMQGLGFVREELARRQIERQQEQMFRLTKQMRDMTIVITLLTVVNVIAVMIAVLK